jgi:hypothetical protein
MDKYLVMDTCYTFILWSHLYFHQTRQFLSVFNHIRVQNHIQTNHHAQFNKIQSWSTLHLFARVPDNQGPAI